MAPSARWRRLRRSGHREPNELDHDQREPLSDPDKWSPIVSPFDASGIARRTQVRYGRRVTEPCLEKQTQPVSSPHDAARYCTDSFSSPDSPRRLTVPAGAAKVRLKGNFDRTVGG